MDITVYIVTFILIIAIYLGFKFMPKIWETLRIRNELIKNFPCPEYHWFLGHLHVFPGVNEQGLMYFSKNAETFPRYYVFLVGIQPSIHINHPEPMKQLTKTTEPKQLGLSGGYRFLLPWIGDGLLLSDGPKWARNRRLLTPGFHFDVLKPYVKIYNEAVERMMDKLETEASSTKSSIDIFKPVGLTSLDIILRCAFSSTKASVVNKENEKYINAVTSLAQQVVNRIINPQLFLDKFFYATSQGKDFLNNCELSHSVAREVMRLRRKELDSTDTITSVAARGRYVDFLDILLLAKDNDGNSLSDQEILDEMETFMFEGHDTTACGMSWILYNLSRHEDIQARARAEVDKLLNGRESDSIEWPDMTELPYLTRCIKESLRLHPPVPYAGRELESPLQLDDKVVPAGTSVNISIWNMHHNPAVWSDPWKYDPDRFLPEKINKMDSHAFMPFSAGPRNCIGQNFAMNEMRTFIARFLHKFEFELDKSKPVEILPDLVLRAKSGIHLHLKSRG